MKCSCKFLLTTTIQSLLRELMGGYRDLAKKFHLSIGTLSEIGRRYEGDRKPGPRPRRPPRVEDAILPPPDETRTRPICHNLRCLRALPTSMRIDVLAQASGFTIAQSDVRNL